MNDHSVVDFIGHPVGTVITDQYQDMGLAFTNFVFIHNAGGYSDGFGLFGNNGVRIEFDTPQHALGVDHLGVVTFALFLDGQLLSTSNTFSYATQGTNFSGIISDHPFDEVYLFVPQPPFPTNTISLDNLYWGMPVPAPGAMPLLAVGLFAGARRRRRW